MPDRWLVDQRPVRLGQHGMRPKRWDDLDLVDHHRRFLDGPMRSLRHVLPDA